MNRLSKKRFRNSSRYGLRSGAATVELAICLPVLLTLVFGTLEICQRIFLRQSAVIAAYEGARLAARGASTHAEVVARCTSLLTNRRVRNATVAIAPADFQTAPTGTELTITISVPWAANTPTRVVCRDQGTLTVRSAMLRE